MATSASEYAKFIGWKSLKECAEFLCVDRSRLSDMWTRDNIKCRSLIAGGWHVKAEQLN
jgi:hypothetical protein